MNTNQEIALEVAKEEYYIQSKQSGHLGNSPVWYAKDGKGYTSYIQGAERFSEEEAERMIKEDSDKWAMWSCAEVNKRLHLVFDIQDKKRLGTDEPCGWHFGYAQNPDEMPAFVNAYNARVSEPVGWLCYKAIKNGAWYPVLTLNKIIGTGYINHSQVFSAPQPPKAELTDEYKDYVKGLEDALKDAKSVLNSINKSTKHKVIIFDCKHFAQTEEWVEWASVEVLECVVKALANKPK